MAGRSGALWRIAHGTAHRRAGGGGSVARGHRTARGAMFRGRDGRLETGGRYFGNFTNGTVSLPTWPVAVSLTIMDSREVPSASEIVFVRTTPRLVIAASWLSGIWSSWVSDI